MKTNTTDDTGEEYLVPVNNDQMEIKDTPDGGAEITLESEQEIPAESSDHFANLAEAIEPEKLASIGAELCDLIERDGTSRARRDTEYANAIKRTGITDSEDDDNNEAAFENSAIVRHPMLIESCIDFSSKVMKEIFPASGPVRDHVPGVQSKDRLEKAKRKKRFMNWQVTRGMREFRDELEQAVTQLPISGSQYIKIYWDKLRRRPRAEFVPDDKIWLPYSATSYYSSDRKTHLVRKTKKEIERLIKAGVYTKFDPSVSSIPEDGKVDSISRKVDGISADGDNVDGDIELFECICYYDIENDGEEKPYLVTIERSTRRVIAIYRNWSEDDDTFESIEHIVQLPFIFWRGAHPIGLNHIIGNLNSAATGALRALLDSAHVNNIPTAIKIEGGSTGAQQIDVTPGSINTIRGSHQMDDIRKSIMPLPFNPPSQTLFQLLEWLSNAGRGVVRTTFEDLADQKTDMPVGTTMALIDQGLTVFSAIYARLHTAMERVFDILQRVNRDNLSEQRVVDDLGELMVHRADFDGPNDVALVSNPLIFSEVQRQAQVALIAQRAALLPNLYNLRKVEEKILEGSRITNVKELLIPAVEPKKLNAANENVAITMGRGLVVYPEQDHIAHIRTHIAYITSPLLGGGAHMQSIVTAPMLQHLKDHLAFWYLNEVYKLSSEAANTDVEKLIDDSDDDVTKKFDLFMAEATDAVIKQMSSSPEAQSLPPIIQQLVQIVQNMSQTQGADPKVAVQQAEVQRKTQADQQTFQLKQQEVQMRMQADQQRAQFDQQRHADDMQVRREAIAGAETIAARNEQNEMIRQGMQEQGERDRSIREAQTKLQINDDDNNVALHIAAMEVASGHKSALSNGNSIGD